MAQFAIEIADADVDRVMDAVAANYNWAENVPNPDFNPAEPVSDENPETIPNPEDKFVFTNRMVRSFLIENVKAHEVKIAKQAAAEAAQASAGVTITDPQV